MKMSYQVDDWVMVHKDYSNNGIPRPGKIYGVRRCYDANNLPKNEFVYSIEYAESGHSKRFLKEIKESYILGYAKEQLVVEVNIQFQIDPDDIVDDDPVQTIKSKFESVNSINEAFEYYTGEDISLDEAVTVKKKMVISDESS
jgi:hypothetical protein